MGAVAGKTKREERIPMNEGYSRRAYHAGSWYSDEPDILNATLSGYLSAASNPPPTATTTTTTSLRAIICPHAGFSYSGQTAAYGYRALEAELSKADTPIRRILVFHPSHHVYLDGCAVSGAHTIETPLGDLPVDDELRQEILEKGNSRLPFSIMKRRVDEAEHSGEMQYPFLAKVQTNANKITKKTKLLPVLPIMCGNISPSKEAEYGKLLGDLIAREDVFSVVSTDFCHWGQRFSYQPTSTSQEIFEHIRDLDKEGMKQIELKKPGAFADYLKKTRNTICGRHAIQTWLNGVVHSEGTGRPVLAITFTKYAQSSQVRSMRESSVSYASAIAGIHSQKGM